MTAPESSADRPIAYPPRSTSAAESRRAARRVEAQTDFTRFDYANARGAGSRYLFGTESDASGAGSNQVPVHIDLEIVATPGAPDDGDAAAAFRSVGEPIIAWVDVTASTAGSALSRETDMPSIDRLLQACTDQAAVLEAVPRVECVAIGVVVSPGHPLRGIVVGVGRPTPMRVAEGTEARRYREGSGRCIACDRLAGSVAPTDRLLHDGTCFGAIVRDGVAPGMVGSAWAVPWAHASTLAAITEDERRDLAQAVAATLQWLVAQAGTWRLWFLQAPVGDDTGDVHLRGQWLRDGCVDGLAWPWSADSSVG